MTRLSKATAALLFLAAAAAKHGAAQATGFPTFFAPTRAFVRGELGATLSRPGGDATAVEGRLGFALTTADVSLRGGYADPGGAADGRVVAGIEAQVPAIAHGPTFPLDGAFIVGVGRHFEDGAGETLVPLGLSVGRRVRLDRSLHVTPYVQPTVIFADDTVFTLGLGVDVALRGLPEVRVSWATGDMEGFSVGLFWGR